MSKTIKSSCKGCPSRSPSCHSTCETYKQFRSDLDKTKAEQRKSSPIYGYTCEQIEKNKRYNFLKTDKRNRKRY